GKESWLQPTPPASNPSYRYTTRSTRNWSLPTTTQRQAISMRHISASLQPTWIEETPMADTTKLVEQVLQSSAYQNLSAPLQTAIFLGLLVFVPAILVSVTGFTRIAIVLSFARRAVTSQDIPPNSVILGLSLFLTLFVMGPTFETIHEHAIS